MKLIGLYEKDVERSRKIHGSNTITQKKRKGFFRQYLSSFSDPIIRILLCALAVNAIFMIGGSSKAETLGIAIAVFLATFVSTLSDYSSESAFEELKKMTEKRTCRVLRSGKITEIYHQDVVVGDIVCLSAGEKIPADGKIVEGKIGVDQSALNGESKETEKTPDVSLNKTSEFESKNSVFCGTNVVSGEGKMLVEKVGDKTFYGSLARDIQEITPESPLKTKLTSLAKTLSKIGYVSAILIAVADLFRSFFISNGMNTTLIAQAFASPHTVISNLMHALTLAIAVVVVAVPEGLPMMIAVVLSSNMLKMKKDNVLVRKPVGIEAAGGLNILFTDKTGTLTKGELSVIGIATSDGTEYPSISECPQTVKNLLEINARYNTSSTCSDKGEIIGGNATDRAILKDAVKTRFAKGEFARISFTPFDSDKKYSVAYVEGSIPVFSKKCAIVKGAPEKILPYCSKCVLSNGETGYFNTRYAENVMLTYTKRGVRVLAVAIGEDFETPKNDLVFVAFILIRDDVRKEVPQAIKEVRGAGVQVVMITGDNPETATAIAKETGLLDIPDPVIITGGELKKLTDDEIKKLLPRLRIVARALPTDKSRLVKISQETGLIIGMTGDGINDAPALKRADVGFAMGSGTEVAKEAGDVVILDDNFASIVKAIRYGRTVFKSIRKFILFQLTMNFCAVGVSLIAPFIGIDTPVTVIQMLWINIIMDTLAGLAFAGEPPLKDYMEEKPIKRSEKVLTPSMCKGIVFTGIYTVMLCLIFLKSTFMRSVFGYYENPVKFQTAFFALFVFSGIFNAFNARTERINLLSHLRENKTFVLFILAVATIQILLVYFGGTAFRTSGISFKNLIFTVCLSVTVIPVDILRKIAVKKIRKPNKSFRIKKRALVNNN